MKRSSLWLGGLALLALGGATFWWLEGHTRPATPAPVPQTKTIRPDSASAAISSPPPSQAGEAAGGGTPENSAVPDQTAAGAPANAAPTVGDILAEPDDNYVRVAGKLLKITLDNAAPIAEREEALAHALNLSAGNETEVLLPLIGEKNLPDELAETVLAEALNRPLDFQADLYLKALGTRTNPELKTKIREHLAFLTGGDDLGPNPADWQKAIQAAKASWPK